MSKLKSLFWLIASAFFMAWKLLWKGTTRRLWKRWRDGFI